MDDDQYNSFLNHGSVPQSNHFQLLDILEVEDAAEEPHLQADQPHECLSLLPEAPPPPPTIELQLELELEESSFEKVGKYGVQNWHNRL